MINKCIDSHAPKSSTTEAGTGAPSRIYRIDINPTPVSSKTIRANVAWLLGTETDRLGMPVMAFPGAADRRRRQRKLIADLAPPAFASLTQATSGVWV